MKKYRVEMLVEVVVVVIDTSGGGEAEFKAERSAEYGGGTSIRCEEVEVIECERLDSRRRDGLGREPTRGGIHETEQV